MLTQMCGAPLVGASRAPRVRRRVRADRAAIWRLRQPRRAGRSLAPAPVERATSRAAALAAAASAGAGAHAGRRAPRSSRHQ